MSSAFGGSSHLEQIQKTVEFIDDFQDDYSGVDQENFTTGYAEFIEKIENPEFNDAIEFVVSTNTQPDVAARVTKAIEEFRTGKSQQEKVAQLIDQGFWNRVQQFHEDLAALTRDETLKKIEVKKSEGSGM